MSGRKLALSIGLTFGFVLLETASGVRAHSLALLSDAGHNFSDALALILSWYALHVASRPASATRTYGYHRVGILTALFNAVTLLVIAFFILRDACLLLAHPHTPEGGLMMAVAGVALVLNTAIALALRGEAAHSVNMRSAFIHMAGDALSSLGVVVAGFVIHTTGWAYADPLVSLLIGGFIVYTSWGIVAETLNVLLEGVPRGLDVRSMADEMRAVPGVMDVHDLHVWTIADGMNALSCHLQVAEPDLPRAAGVVREIKMLLATNYGVGPSTIETECGGCNAPDLYCQLAVAHAGSCDHSH
jgi:cobalt-zinc-cadmium efflux system protein